MEGGWGKKRGAGDAGSQASERAQTPALLAPIRPRTRFARIGSDVDWPLSLCHHHWKRGLGGEGQVKRVHLNRRRPVAVIKGRGAPALLLQAGDEVVVRLGAVVRGGGET